MKDQLIAILEAIRLSQAALEKHFQRGGNAVTTLNEIRRVLQDQNVARAMGALYPEVESPNTSPGEVSCVEKAGELHTGNSQPKRLS